MDVSFAASVVFRPTSVATGSTQRRPRVPLPPSRYSGPSCDIHVNILQSMRYHHEILCEDISLASQRAARVQQLQRLRVGLMVEDIGARFRLAVWNTESQVLAILEELERLSIALMRGGTVHGERGLKEEMRKLLWELRKGLEDTGYQADFRLRASVEATRSELLDMAGEGFSGGEMGILMEEVVLLQELRWLRMLESQVVQTARERYSLNFVEVEEALKEFGKVAGMMGMDEYRVRGKRRVIDAGKVLLQQLDKIGGGCGIDAKTESVVKMMETAFERSIRKDAELRQPHGEVMLLRPRIQDIPNFDRVTDQLLRGGQPNAYGLKWLVDYGVRLIIDLRGSDRNNQWATSDLPWSDIPVKNIPIEDFDVPTIQQAHLFVETVDQAHINREPVFVHCKAGIGRTGTLISCWRVASGEPVERALEKEALYSSHGGGLWQENFVRKFALQMSRLEK